MTYPVKQLVLSHSSRSTMRSCMRKFEFSKMYGDASDREDNFAGDVGNALHRGFQEFLVNGDETKAIHAMALAYPLELENRKYENKARSLDACYATLMEMCRSPITQEYEVAHIKTRFGDVRPAIEVPFAFRIVDAPLPIPVYFVGFIDAILRSRHTGAYGVSDIKTTRMFIQDYSVRYEFDEQTVPYAIVLEHMLQQEIVELDVSYISTFIDLMEPKVARYSFKKTQEYIHDWHYGLCDDIERIGRYMANVKFPRATDGNTCFSFNRPCYFAEYCSVRDPSIITRMLKTEVRDGLFRDGIEPWVVADLPFIPTVK